MRAFSGHRVGPVLLAALLALAGCHHDAGHSAEKNTYILKGTVVSVDVPHGVVTVRHEAIPGFMDAMTMPYPLRDANVATELHAGDRILAQLQVQPTGAVLDDVTVTAQAQPNALPPVQYHVPAAGDVVPDFALVDQDGHHLHLADFRGRVLAITFIYTRCPLANFCPQMSHNFAQADAALAADPKLYAATHLLSISFDPKYDTPAVLKSYGGAYTGRYTRETFAHWQFTAPTLAELPKLEQWFDLGVTPGENNTLSHSLATLIVGRDGRVVDFNPTNSWTAAELTQKIEAAVAAKGK